MHWGPVQGVSDARDVPAIRLGSPHEVCAVIVDGRCSGWYSVECCSERRVQNAPRQNELKVNLCSRSVVASLTSPMASAYNI